MIYCNKCGKTYEGRHDCKAQMSLAERLAQEAEGVNDKVSIDNDSHSQTPKLDKPQKDEPVNTGVAYDPTGPERVRRWRENNREAYNAYMREYRRKRRQVNNQ